MYDLTILLPAQKQEDDNQDILEKISQIIKSQGGKILDEEKKGNTSLSYQIAGRRQAYFYNVRFSMDSEKIVLLQKELKLLPSILRSLLTSVDADRELKKGAASLKARGKRIYPDLGLLSSDKKMKPAKKKKAKYDLEDALKNIPDLDLGSADLPKKHGVDEKELDKVLASDVIE